MILIVTQQSDISADLVIQRLQEDGHRFARLNCERLLSEVLLSTHEPEGAATLVDEAGERLDLQAARAIWYRSPQLPVTSADLTPPNARFAQREAWAHALGLLMSLDAPWMSNPAAIWRANQKVFQLAEARRRGLRIPRTCITRSPEEAWSFICSVSSPVIAKPVTYGSIEGTTSAPAPTTSPPTPPSSLPATSQAGTAAPPASPSPSRAPPPSVALPFDSGRGSPQPSSPQPDAAPRSPPVPPSANTQ
jgi:hypothetical protein